MSRKCKVSRIINHLATNERHKEAAIDESLRKREIRSEQLRIMAEQL